jgi:hypothetical protein
MRIRSTLTAFAMFVAIAAATLAAEAKKPAAKPPMDEKAMMEMWAKLGAPGEAHKALEPMVGTWDTKVTSWMQPGSPPMTSSGVSENRWTMGNRFIEQRFNGSFMDQPFEGLGYTGYDNIKKKYVGTWMDSMGTSIMYTTGTADPSGKSMTFTGTMEDPMTGKPMTVKNVLKVVDNDKHNFEMWGPGPNGKTYKMMEIEYTRKN